MVRRALELDSLRAHPSSASHLRCDFTCPAPLPSFTTWGRKSTTHSGSFEAQEGPYQSEPVPNWP